jgi:FkbM family methyltransferase
MKYFSKISIVTPNYNGGDFLEETIKSVVNQNYPNLEYIIIDGGSTDNSIEIIKKYEKHLSYWVSEKDSGMYDALQKGFEKATGEILAWINSDDMYHSKSLFTVNKIFSDIPNVKWLTGLNTYYNEEGITFTTRKSFNHSRFTQILFPNKYIQQESTFWTKKLWKEAGGYIDKSLKYAGDFELWMRFNRYSQIYITDALIGGFRIRNNQLSQQFKPIYEKECKKVIEKELTLFSKFDKKILEEIKNFSFIKSIENNTLNVTQKRLIKQNEEINYNIKKNKFEIKDNNMNSILKQINKKRDTMKEFLEFLKLDKNYYPDIILDVGVAHGTPELYETFPKSQFILFEALHEFEPVIKEFKKKYLSLDYELVALGDKEDIIEINVHPDLVGSSIFLEDEDSDVNGEPRKIELKPLDYYKEKYNFDKKNILLKVDVQGAELQVLKGAINTLDFINVVILEISLFDFFNNKISFLDISNFLNENGFCIYEIFNFTYRPLDKALAQIDVAFVKKNSLFKKENIFATKEQREQLNNELTKISLQTSDAVKINENNYNFSKLFSKLYDSISFLKNNNQKYIVYGNGSFSKLIKSILSNQILCIVDIQSEIDIFDKNLEQIYNPKVLKSLDFDKVIISVLGREDEIIKYLVEELNINTDKIITLDIQ